MSQTQVLIPIQQDIVDFDGYPVIGVRLPNGRIGASLRDMCDAMKIDRASQVQRIHGDETIADSLVSVQIQTRGGFQVADFLTAWAIPYWLTGIELSRIKDEKKRQTVLLFKRKAADVLYQHFSQRSVLPSPTSLVPAESVAQPVQPMPDAPASEWATYHEQMALFYHWKGAVDHRLDDIEQWQGTVESRLEGVEAMTGFIPKILEQMGQQTLTPEHQRAVQKYSQQLHEATGKPYGTIYDNLKTAFGIPKYSDIPEADWDKVINWFKVQIERSKKK